MPSEPLQSIIYRDLAIANAKPLIDIASPLLRELINFGSNALVRCATSSQGQVNEDLAIFSLYRHILEMTDGVETLIAQACAVPAVPLVRSSFEALISIEYILFENDKYVIRSLAWLVDYLHKRIATYEMMNPTTERGNEFQKSLQDDESVQKISLPDTVELDKAIKNLQGLLSDPQFTEINQDYTKLKGKKVWYRLYGGPDNLQKLAHFVGRSALYDFMYCYWSSVAHAQDFTPFIAKTQQGEGTIRPIRDPQELKNVANYSASVMLAATRRLIQKFRPDEDIKSWYLRDVRPLYARIYSKG